ncbi:DUF4959 domain-containing protein [Mariniflexile sp. AS56]|uniref:DUF4959 domain-containing protein n=1 Tax=Mariniflexile sp. AS56 TaxID=3063957 RepID=UPI0026EDC7D4|nr:DUF4959 domain-containing protein [Mariniflexile sp. AS56]MDO7174020.1 DUF4959 domain-containing protein [Mariniflexile sp. AS56]
MKTKFKVTNIALSALFIFVVACGSEEFIGQPSSNSTAPGSISNVQSIGTPGGAIITYNIPDDEDFSHVEAVYNVSEGQERKSVATKYIQTVNVDGFGDTLPKVIELYAVDKSGNRSEKVETEITPLTPPYLALRESLEVSNDFAGVLLKWENETDAKNLGITILKHDEFGDFVPYETVYDDASNLRYQNVRGMDTLAVELGFYVKDQWGHISDTLIGIFKPLYEIQLDRKKWKALRLDTDIPQESNGQRFERAFDGDITKSRGSAFNTTNDAEFSYSPLHWTLDMGEENLYSRFIIYATEWVDYNRGAMRVFEIYGTNDQSLIDRETNGAYVWPNDDNPHETGNWREEGMDGWELIGEFEAVKPSGLPGIERGPGDRDFAEGGMNFNMPGGSKSYRYLRIRQVENWETQIEWVTFAEIEFFGAPVNK